MNFVIKKLIFLLFLGQLLVPVSKANADEQFVMPSDWSLLSIELEARDLSFLELNCERRGKAYEKKGEFSYKKWSYYDENC